jgi:hypothetical protein
MPARRDLLDKAVGGAADRYARFDRSFGSHQNSSPPDGAAQAERHSVVWRPARSRSTATAHVRMARMSCA